MFVEDIQVGMKVVPTARTISRNKELVIMPATHSVIWRRAQSIEQPYLFVQGADENTGLVNCAVKAVEDEYDTFMDYDLEEFENA